MYQQSKILGTFFQNKKMKIKLITILTLIFLMFTSVNALDISSSQSSNINDLLSYDIGNERVFDITSNINNEIIVNGNNYSYDFDLEYNAVSENIYLKFNNPQVNNTLTFLWSGDLTRDDTLYVQNFTMNEQGTYYFKFTPDYVGEPAHVYVDIVNDFASPITINELETKPQGFNDLIGGLVSSFNDIIEVNVTFWKILLYTTIFIITLSIILSIFGLAFWIFSKAKDVKKIKFMSDD